MSLTRWLSARRSQLISYQRRRQSQALPQDLQVIQRPRLPPEVFDVILEWCFEDGDKKTLIVCSQVCRDWVRATRRRLFGQVLITWYGLRRGRERRLFKLMKSPHCTFIHTLHSVVIHGGSSSWQSQSLDTFQKSGAVIHELDIIFHSTDIVRSLDTPSATSSVTHLKVNAKHSSSTQIITYISSFPNLRHLHIKYGQEYNGDGKVEEMSLSSKLQSLKLETLSRGRPRALLGWMLAQKLRLQDLGVLFIPSAEDHETLKEYFIVNPTLQHLTVRIFDSSKTGYDGKMSTNIQLLP
jgi:hypothetical protein